MAEKTCVTTVENQLVIEGILDNSTVVILYEQAKNLLAGMTHRDIKVDLSRVQRTESVGLSLLLSLMRAAKSMNKSIHFLNMPDKMRAIAEVSNLETLLPVA